MIQRFNFEVAVFRDRLKVNLDFCLQLRSTRHPFLSSF